MLAEDLASLKVVIALDFVFSHYKCKGLQNCSVTVN